MKSENSGESTESSFQEKSRAPTKVYEKQSSTHAMAPDAEMSNMTLNDLQSTPAPQAKSNEGLDSMSKRSSVERALKSAEASNEVFFTDLKGANEPVRTGLAPPLMRRSPSPTGSDSSGEFIIFAGRRHSCKKGDQTHTSDVQSKALNGQKTNNVSKLSGHHSFVATVIDDPIKVRTERIQDHLKQRPRSFSPSDSEKVPGHLNGNSGATAIKPRRRRRGRHPRQEAKDEGILDDYIANLRDGGDLEAFVESSMLSQRNLNGSDSTGWQDEVEFLSPGRVERHSLENSKWDSADLGDFDELSTSNEALDSIEQVLSKRERPSGVQYLVTRAGYTVDDARWFTSTSLNIPGAEALIQEFEDKAELNLLLDGSDVSDASLTIDEQMAQDLQEDLDDHEDEKDLEDTRQARMTDEQIARLLSKQEELGLGSSDLMLFSGGDVETNSEEEVQLDGLWERAATHRAPFRSKGTKRSPSNFPSATAFADVLDQDPYKGFDVMDQQRPSLRKRPKDRRGKLSMDLSDSELEQSIQASWEKDRTKKKMRKQEREELRVQGLLGKKNKIDMKAKYSEGMTMTEVKNEIREFLKSSMDSLPLPPMAQGQRKMVHELANVFKLKSKSIGGGKSRFPVLYRTSRTMQYNEEVLTAVESVLSSRRFLPRMDKAKKKGGPAGRDRRGGGASASVSYRDGEVVGATAPEIGQENRGRTMLEKMGWSSGTALGALNNNRGLVQPVEQVVKTSRSGLG
ncbi:MAG: hypothetical protein Q9161_009550 [Pseudevernia consocians]